MLRSGRKRDGRRFNDRLNRRLLHGRLDRHNGRLSGKGGGLRCRECPFGGRSRCCRTVLRGIVFRIKPAALPLDFFLASLFLVGLELRTGLCELLELSVELALDFSLCIGRRDDWLCNDRLWRRLGVVFDCRSKVRELLEDGLERILLLGRLVDDYRRYRSLRGLPFAQGEL